MKKMTRYGAMALGIGLLAGGFAQSASAYIWTGAADSDYFNTNNWAASTSDSTPPSGFTAGDFDIITNATYSTVPVVSTSGPEGTRGVWVGKYHVGTPGRGSMTVTTGANVVWDSNTSRVGLGNPGIGVLTQDGGSITWHSLDIGLDSGSTGTYIQTGGTNICGKTQAGNVSIRLGSGGNGTIQIQGGVFKTRGGIANGLGTGTGTFEVIGADSTIGVGSEGTVDGFWTQLGGSTLKCGIDTGGISPILVDDVSTTSGVPSAATATFAANSLLEPYFVDSVPQTGKWTVMTVEGPITDNGLVLVNGGDPNWSYNIVSNTVEVWYGLGDSGYGVEPPAITYIAGDVFWDGEAGDQAWNNPTNWVAAGYPDNNILPLTGVGTVGASLRFDGTNNFAVYTADEGDRYYKDIIVGYNSDGRLDMTGGKLVGDNSANHYIGRGGHAGTVNVSGGTLVLNGTPLRMAWDANSAGYINVSGGTMIFGRESGGIAGVLGGNGGTNATIAISGGAFRTRAGLELSSVATFVVQGAGATQIGIGSESSVDGSWIQNAGSRLQALVATNGLTKIFIDDYNNDGAGAQGNATFHDGSLLDVGFLTDGVNGSWDVMQWEGSLVASNLAFAAGVDTNTWSFAFVDTDATNGVDTLRITATGFGPTVQPDITAFSVVGSTVNLSWDSEPGSSYNVLSKPALTASTWTTNAGPIPGAGATTSTNLTGSGTAEFYKIEAY